METIRGNAWRFCETGASGERENATRVVKGVFTSLFPGRGSVPFPQPEQAGDVPGLPPDEQGGGGNGAVIRQRRAASVASNAQEIGNGRDRIKAVLDFIGLPDGEGFAGRVHRMAGSCGTPSAGGAGCQLPQLHGGRYSRSHGVVFPALHPTHDKSPEMGVQRPSLGTATGNCCSEARVIDSVPLSIHHLRGVAETAQSCRGIIATSRASHRVKDWGSG